MTEKNKSEAYVSFQNVQKTYENHPQKNYGKDDKNLDWHSRAIPEQIEDKNPEKYFTKELMHDLNIAAETEFKYGQKSESE